MNYDAKYAFVISAGIEYRPVLYWLNIPYSSQTHNSRATVTAQKKSHTEADVCIQATSKLTKHNVCRNCTPLQKTVRSQENVKHVQKLHCARSQFSGGTNYRNHWPIIFTYFLTNQQTNVSANISFNFLFMRIVTQMQTQSLSAKCLAFFHIYCQYVCCYSHTDRCVASSHYVSVSAVKVSDKLLLEL